MAPDTELYKVVDGMPILDFTDRIYGLYSNCPNARFCHTYDLYCPQCEDLVFTPACLHWLFSELDILKRVLADTGRRFSSLRPLESHDQRTQEEPGK